MKQTNLNNLNINDCVVTSDGFKGYVACIIEDSKFSDKYTENDWGYLQTGILIMTDEVGLIYYPSTSAVKKAEV